MRLLSRVADRLYWTGRYMERVEGIARLTQAYTHLVMDIPQGSELGWDVLVKILDAEPLFESRYKVYSEQNVLHFLIADEANPGSIYQSVMAARSNVRTTRDVLPQEVWEQVNELYLYTREFAEKSVGRRNRHRFLDRIQARCQAISGHNMSTMCRDEAYRFMSLGHLLERADMTTRIIDVGAGALMDSERHNVSMDPLIWGALLQGLSAMSTYRRKIGPLPEAAPVVNFLFNEATLPRSLKFCLNGIRSELGQLRKHTDAVRHVERARRRLARFDTKATNWETLHPFIDRIQLDLSNLSDCISESWFLPTER
tara:strand:- start:18358 stop:19296 length:939 start_codon:yes stop_codon:yes gene_type:complete